MSAYAREREHLRQRQDMMRAKGSVSFRRLSLYVAALDVAKANSALFEHNETYNSGLHDDAVDGWMQRADELAAKLREATADYEAALAALATRSGVS